MPTLEELGQKVKAKYPGAYDDVPDADLAKKVQAKYPGAYDDYTASEAKSVGGFASNVASSAGSLISNVAHAVANPIKTIAAVGDTAEGLANQYVPGYGKAKQVLGGSKYDPQVTARQNEMAEGLKQNISDRYGSVSKFGETLYKDPVGVLADLSTFADGAGLALKGTSIAAKAGKVGQLANVADKGAEIASTVSRAANPVALTGKAVGPVLQKAVGKLRIGSSLDTAEQAAVDWARQNNIPLDLATATGNKAVQNVQGVLQNAPGVAGYAKGQRLAQGAAMKSAGEDIAQGVSKNAATAESAGQGVADTLGTLEKSQGKSASSAYSKLEQIENQPGNIQKIQIGTVKKDTGVLDASGQPIIKETPQFKTVATPVDMRPVKDSLRPIYDAIKEQMPVAQQRASYGLKAIENIMNGEDVVSASTADQNLSAIKAIQRDAINPKSKYLASQAVTEAGKAVDAAVGKAGPDAVAALQEGRDMTKAKYATQATAEQLRTEPVQLFSQLTHAKDSGIGLLRDVAGKAPDALPAVGRAYFEGLMDKAFAEAGQAKPGSALTEWQKLGPETKNLLFGKSTKDIDNFLTLAKKVAENPNPSGSGYVAQIGIDGGLVLTQPHIGIPYVMGKAALGRALMNPKAAPLLTQGLRIPAGSSAGKALSARIAATIGSTEAKISDEGQPVQ